MMKRFNDRPSLLFIALVVLTGACLSCSDSSTSGPGWEVEQTVERHYPISQGIYRGHFHVIEDGCEPSLQSVIDESDDYPLPLLAVFRPTPPPNAPSEHVSFQAYSWRNVRVTNVGFQLNRDTHIPVTNNPLFTDHWETIIGYMLISGGDLPPWPCGVNQHGLARSKIVVTQPARNTIEVRIDDDWSDIPECTSPALYDFYPTLPKAACRESYVATYILEEGCDAPCEVDVDGGYGTGFSSSDHMPRFVYSKYPPTCVCP